MPAVVRLPPLLLVFALALTLASGLTACTGGSDTNRQPPAPAATVTAAGTPTPAATPAPTPTATPTPAPAAPTPSTTPTPTATVASPPRLSGPIDISRGQHTLTVGAYKYSLGSRATLFFDVPAGLRLEIGGQIRSEGVIGLPESFGLHLKDIDSQSWITFDLQSGREWNRWIDAAASGIGALFDKLAQSVRVSPPPTPTPTPRALGTAAEPFDISGWEFTDRTFSEGVYQFALGRVEQLLIFEVPAGLRLQARFTGAMPDDQSCRGLLLTEVWNGSKLCLDVHRAVELSRATRDSATEQFFDRLVASLRLGPPDEAAADCVPVIDVTYGLRVVLTGGNTYLLQLVLAGEPPPFITFDVPVGVSIDLIIIDRPDRYEAAGTLHLWEATSGSRLAIDIVTGEEQERELLPVPSSESADLGAIFDQIVASMRFGEIPTVTGCPAGVAPSLEQTVGEGSYRFHYNPDLYHGIHSVPHVIFEVPAGLQLQVAWDTTTPLAIRLTDVDTDSWLCLDAELLVECGRSVRPNTAHVGPLFDQIAESLRLGRLRD